MRSRRSCSAPRSSVISFSCAGRSAIAARSRSAPIRDGDEADDPRRLLLRAHDVAHLLERTGGQRRRLQREHDVIGRVITLCASRDSPGGQSRMTTSYLRASGPSSSARRRVECLVWSRRARGRGSSRRPAARRDSGSRSRARSGRSWSCPDERLGPASAGPHVEQPRRRGLRVEVSEEHAVDSAASQARCTAVVVLPTPPLTLYTATTFTGAS